MAPSYFISRAQFGLSGGSPATASIGAGTTTDASASPLDTAWSAGRYGPDALHREADTPPCPIPQPTGFRHVTVPSPRMRSWRQSIGRLWSDLSDPDSLARAALAESLLHGLLSTPK
jgi:hypothetical protein